MRRSLPILIIVAVLLLSLFGAWYWKRSAARTSTTTATPTPQRQRGPQGQPKQGATPAHTRGSADAPVLLEEFADFECGGCAAVHPIIKNVQIEFGSQVALVFRQFPLSIHKHSTIAAQAAEAAALQGKFWEMYDLLFQNQPTWHQAADARPLFREYAGKLGLDVERFDRDMSSEEVANRIAADKARAQWIGVNSTPTVFMNGREVPFDALTDVRLRELIRAELNSPGIKK